MCHPCVSVCHPQTGCKPFAHRYRVSVSPFISKKNHSKQNCNLTVTQLQRIILTGGQAQSRLSHVTLNVLARPSQRFRTAQDEATIEKRIPLGYIAKKNKKLAQLTQKYLHELLLFSIFAADLSNTDAKIFA